MHTPHLILHAHKHRHSVLGQFATHFRQESGPGESRGCGVLRGVEGDGGAACAAVVRRDEDAVDICFQDAGVVSYCDGDFGG